MFSHVSNCLFISYNVQSPKAFQKMCFHNQIGLNINWANIVKILIFHIKWKSFVIRVHVQLVHFSCRVLVRGGCCKKYSIFYHVIMLLTLFLRFFFFLLCTVLYANILILTKSFSKIAYVSCQPGNLDFKI